MLGERHSDLLRLMVGGGQLQYQQRHALSQTPKQLVARESSIHNYTACRKLIVTETTNMGESNGTNLKPIPPIIFFIKLMKIAKY